MSLNDIQNSYNKLTGIIIINSILDQDYYLTNTTVNVGGIVGMVGKNEFELGNEVLLEKVYNEAEVTIIRNNSASGYDKEDHTITFNLGGILGQGYSTSIKQASNSGKITIDLNYTNVGYNNENNVYISTTKLYVAGIAGYLREGLYWDESAMGYLYNVVNYANVSTELNARNNAMKVGGIVGNAYGIDVRNAVFTGNLQFPNSIYPIYYGITGWDGDPTIINSYFKSQAINGRALEMSAYDEAESPGRGSISSYWLKQEYTYNNWDFDNIWDITNNTTYPWLRNLASNIDIANGSESEPTVNLNSLPLPPQEI